MKNLNILDNGLKKKGRLTVADFDCIKCKNFKTDICTQCSLFDGDKSCTCFQGMAPCGYCENILYMEEQNVNPNRNPNGS